MIYPCHLIAKKFKAERSRQESSAKLFGKFHLEAFWLIWLSRLDPQKLHVTMGNVSPHVFALPRCYTLTHSDRTGDLYLTVASDFDQEQISGLYTRLMRDEVLAEWKMEKDLLFLSVHCHVSGGFVFGTASLRESIFRRELRLVLEAIRYGDSGLFKNNPMLDQAEIRVHFKKPKTEDCKIESWGSFGDYKIERAI
jgi:hypothetical protein